MIHHDDMKAFLTIIELIKGDSLDKTARFCFVIGIMAGLNADNPDIHEKIIETFGTQESIGNLFNTQDIKDFDN